MWIREICLVSPKNIQRFLIRCGHNCAGRPVVEPAVELLVVLRRLFERILAG